MVSRIIYINKIYLFIFLFLMISFSYADRKQVKQVSLDECIKIALQNKADLRISDEDIRIAKNNEIITSARKKPNLSLSVTTIERDKDSDSSNDVAVPGRDSEYALRMGLNLTYNLVDPTYDASKKVAENDIEASYINKENKKNEIITEVKNAYYNYLNSLHILEARKEIKERYDIRYKITKVLVENGQKPVIDLISAEVHQASQNLSYENAKSDERIKRAALLEAMGLVKDTGVKFAEINLKKIPVLSLSLEEYQKLAEQHAISIKIQKLKKKNLRLNIEKAAALHWPKVTGGVGVGYDSPSIDDNNGRFAKNRDDDTDEWVPRMYAYISASLPIYAGGSINAAYDKSIAMYNKGVFEEKEFLLKLKKQIENIYNQMQQQKEQIKISRLCVENAKLNLKLAERNYEGGAGSQMEMQNAGIALVNTKIELINNRFNYFKNLANLSNLIGLGEKYLCKY